MSLNFPDHNISSFVKQNRPDYAETPKSNVSTPSRKISSSRFITAFTQFYGTNDDGESSNSQNNKDSRAVQRNSDETGTEVKSKMESKLMSMWHNVKYGWSGKLKSNFSKEQPVWLLGRCYHRKYSPVSSMENSAEMTSSLELKNTSQEQFVSNSEELDTSIQELGTDVADEQNAENAWEEEGIEAFKKDFTSRLWMTYRREFPIMNGSNYTSDCGWGCMLRSGQMLLAQGMICHFLGRTWRWDQDTQLYTTHEDNIHRKILRWFGDSSSRNSPFSIHTLVTLGQETGKKPGDWYGPGAVSHLMRQAVKQAAQENADFDGLNVYVAQDCTVYIQDVLDECEILEQPIGSTAPWHQAKKTNSSPTLKSPNKINWKALILLVPLRLGTEKLNPIYANSLKALLSTEYCIGIIGGRPKHSLYYVGYQEDKLIYLDPHYCQEMVDVNQENFPVNSFHCKSPRKMKMTKMDPCCCIGFYCSTRADFDNFIASVQPYLLPIRSTQSQYSNSYPSVDINYPMFVFCRGRSTDQQSEISEIVYRPVLHQNVFSKLTTESDDDDDEEFVII